MDAGSPSSAVLIADFTIVVEYNNVGAEWICFLCIHLPDAFIRHIQVISEADMCILKVNVWLHHKSTASPLVAVTLPLTDILHASVPTSISASRRSNLSRLRVETMPLKRTYVGKFDCGRTCFPLLIGDASSAINGCLYRETKILMRHE